MSISEKFAPTADQRQLLKHRGRELTDSLHSMDEKQAKEAIAALVSRLLLTYPQSHRGKQDESEQLVGVYVEALIDLPLWAVHAACQGWIRGEADGDNRFRPSAAELRKLAQRKCIPFRQELEQIKRILNAKIHNEPTPEERQRVLERFQTVLADTMSVPKEAAA